MTQKADPPARQNIEISGAGHTINVGEGSTWANVNLKVSWYQKTMANHGFGYWAMHGLVALVVVAFWECRHWFFSLFQ